jgi:hypothetical protein
MRGLCGAAPGALTANKGVVMVINGHASGSNWKISTDHNIPSIPNPTNIFVPMRTCRLSPRHGTANPLRP